MQVVEHDADGLRLGQGADDVADGREGPGLDDLAAQLSQGRGRVGLQRDSEQTRHERVCADDVGRQRSEGRLQLEADAGLRGIGRDTQPIAQELADRPVRRPLRVRGRAALQEADLIARAYARFCEQPCLADARLARDGEDHTTAVCHRLAGLGEDRERLLPAHDRHLAPDVGRPALARDPESLDGTLDAA